MDRMNQLLNLLTSSINPGKAKRQQNIALISLLTSGLLLGITTNLARLAPVIGIPPLPYLTWSLLGATVLLLAIANARGQVLRLNHRTIEYFIVAGFLTTAGANLIFFNAVTRLGVSFVAMMIALPPLFTYTGAIILRLEKFNWIRAAGVAIALTGTAILVVERQAVGNIELAWVALTLIGPVLLAAGNLYRTCRWPPGVSSESLAPGTLIAGTLMLFVYAIVTGEPLRISSNHSYSLLLIVLQSMIFSGQFLLMFILQKAGGPVLMSLIGGVSAVCGVPIAMTIFNEPMLPMFVVSAFMVLVGIVSLLVNQCTSTAERSAA